MIPFSKFLQLIEADIPAALVSSTEVQALKRLSQQLPLDTAGVLECRLDEQRPAADLALRISRRPTAAASIESDLPSGEAWEGVHNFYHYWSALPSLAFIERTWLEFDYCMEGAAAISKPSLFFGWSSTELATSVLGKRISKAVELAQELPCAPSLLHFCLEALPSSSQLFHVGLMIHRSQPSLRLCIQDRSVEPLVDLLKSLGLSSTARQVQQYLRPYFSLSNNFALHLDLGRQISHRVSLECYTHGEVLENSWAAFFQQLSQDQFCQPQKIAALSEWAGRLQLIDRSNLWPSTWKLPRQGKASQQLPHVRRLINHIKFVLSPHQAPQTKAYLYFGKHYSSTKTLSPLAQ